VRNIFTGSHIEHCWRCPQKLALKLKAKEREKEIQQDLQNNKQNISSRKIVVIWELDPLTPKVYIPCY
jgi:hypothetical protein